MTPFAPLSEAGDAPPRLVLFTERLRVRFAVGIKEFLAALLPRSFEFRGGDVPVRPAFSRNGSEVLAELFHGRPPEKPIAVIDLVNDQTRLENNRVRNHGIVRRIRIFGDVEIFLDLSRRVRQEGPVRADPAPVFVCLGDVIGADRNQPAIGNLKFPMKLNQPFGLAPVLGAIATAAENQDHRMRALQIGELPVFRGVVGKFVVRKNRSWNDISSHKTILDWIPCKDALHLSLQTFP